MPQIAIGKTRVHHKWSARVRGKPVAQKPFISGLTDDPNPQAKLL
jgi:hypothetical protein